MEPSRSVATLLPLVARGDERAREELYQLIYAELEAVAERCIRQQPGHHTVSPCDLVHDAFIKLTKTGTTPSSRSHFFSFAAQAMRWILVDRARARLRAKRKPAGEQVSLSIVCASAVDPVEVIALHEALEEFAEVDPRAAAIVEKHYFAGMDFREIAEVLSIGERTVQRQWAAARAYLASVLK